MTCKDHLRVPHNSDCPQIVNFEELVTIAKEVEVIMSNH